MSMVPVHNITDRPNTPGLPQAYIVGGKKLRPGKSTSVDRGVFNKTHLRTLHGTCLWVGPLPPRFVRTSRGALNARDLARAGDTGEERSPMTLEEARAYLNEFRLSDLGDLRDKMSPPLGFKTVPAKPALVARVSRALFQANRELDPEVFFWLRRWTRDRHGDYALKE